MSTFRSRQRSAQRRQPTTPAERNAPPAGKPQQQTGKSFDKPRFGGQARYEGGVDKPRFGGEPRREGGFDKPRFGDKPPRREGGFEQSRRDGEFQPRGERSFDKPRFGDKPPRRDGEFQPRGERSFDKPRFGNEQRREGGFEQPRRDGEFQPRGERSFDKPRFGGEQRREGGFDKPRRDGEFQPRGERSFDKPRFGNEQRREGGFDKPRRDGEFQPRGERSFDKPRFGGEQRREGGFDQPRRDGEFQPRGESNFDKPRFGDKPPRREGGFDQPRRDGEFQPRGERSFDKPRFGDKPPRREGGFDQPRRDGEFQPRDERSFDKPRFGNASRGEGGLRDERSLRDQKDFQPRGDHAIDKPRTLFSVKKQDAADHDTPAAEKRYTRDRVAGRGGKAHPDYVAPPVRDEQDAAPAPAAAAPRSSSGFLKRVGADEAPRASAERNFEQPRRDDEFQPRGERSFDKPRFGDKPPRREGGFEQPRRDGEFQPRGERSFDKPRFGGEQRREGGFDKPRRDGEFQPRGERGFDKPRFGDKPPRREGGFEQPRRDGGVRRDDESSPRPLFGKGKAESQGSGDKVGRTPFVKTQFRALQDGELALFATCPRGLEKILADEIAQQGGQELQATDGGVACIGNRELMMRINLHSRVASRVLMQLAQGSFQVERDIYELARSIAWPELFDVACTIKVNTDGHARLRSMDYVSLLVKDAICDRFRDACGARPSVDTRHPDMRIRVFLSGFDVQIYLDTSGEALFKRGWREETGEAPLRENLAAGVLLLAGYNGTQPLLDPMCGSGTLLVEAADIALNRAPGRDRRFAFEQLQQHNDLLWHSVRNDAALAERQAAPLPLFGNDRDPQLVEIARRNLARVGLAELVTLSCGDATALAAPADRGLVVCNPPYGVRLDEQETLAALYPLLASWLKRNFAGWHAHLLTADSRLPSLMRLSVGSQPALFNGALACHVYGFELVAGSNRKDKDDADGQ